MDRNSAIKQMREACNVVSGEVTRLHQLAPGLSEAATQGEVLKALFELTKQVEVVKKHLLRLEKRDDSSLL
jgi:hypothetical protein